ncbi:MAG: hypothetical protein EDM69_03360 [Chlorobiota bacterium]|nr:MAG: hypothetical protein EDM69_03360 [Chlorobiota bacterium]MCE7952706.1 hypothetical protein [Chlorobi bacterium CHB7]OQY77847.1 MAG: hypothetical protein B6D43_04875 [Ignavibacteriales bacterium UTCHB1]RIK50343.1 MAG: hypothetical protein DCC60_00645 [Ignavibacteriota bacterium]
MYVTNFSFNFHSSIQKIQSKAKSSIITWGRNNATISIQREERFQPYFIYHFFPAELKILIK